MNTNKKVVPEPVPNTVVEDQLLNRDDIISVCNTLMTVCIPYTLFSSCNDTETMAAVKHGLNDYAKTISLVDYLVQVNLKEDIVGALITSPQLRLYMRNLDRAFISNVVSKTGLTYPQIVESVVNIITSGLSTDKNKCVWDDNIYIEGRFNVNEVKELLMHNSILFTIYFFKSAFTMSAAYSIID